MTLDIYATTEPFEIKLPNSPYPAQDETPASGVISPSSSASGAGSNNTSPPSSTTKPNSASDLGIVTARTGVVMGFVTFGGMVVLGQ